MFVVLWGGGFLVASVLSTLFQAVCISVVDTEALTILLYYALS